MKARPLTNEDLNGMRRHRQEVADARQSGFEVGKSVGKFNAELKFFFIGLFVGALLASFVVAGACGLFKYVKGLL